MSSHSVPKPASKDKPKTVSFIDFIVETSTPAELQALSELFLLRGLPEDIQISQRFSAGAAKGQA